LKSVESDLDIRKQELEAAINNLQLLKVGATQNSKQVSNIVNSTVKGMVLDVIVEEGSSVVERNNFNEGTSIASIADMSNLIFEGKVDESDVGKLNEGMPMKLKIGALENETIEAILEYISPKGIEEEGTVKFEIKAAITANDDIFLRAGYSANADVIISKVDSVYSIKERDVIYRNDSIFVEIKNESGTFEEIELIVGISDGINTEVKSGIDTTALIKIQMAENN
jgi:HlyD family secretion protein